MKLSLPLPPYKQNSQGALLRLLLVMPWYQLHKPNIHSMLITIATALELLPAMKVSNFDSHTENQDDSECDLCVLLHKYKEGCESQFHV